MSQPEQYYSNLYVGIVSYEVLNEMGYVDDDQ